MGEQIWIKNLKTDINQLELYQLEIKRYIDYESNIQNKYTQVQTSIIRQFSDSLEAIIMLLNSNYKTPSTLVTGRINNINGVFIYLRKIIESDMMLNIILNGGEQLYDLYLEQSVIDESHVGRMFKDTNNNFKTKKQKSTKKYNWLEKAFDIRINSLDVLIDLANIVPEAKSNFKAWVKECNYMSHPTLYSDNQITSQFNGEFIKDIYYVFEVLFQVICAFYEMIKVIENIPKFTSKYDVNLIKARIPKFLLFERSFFDKLNNNFLNGKEFKPIDFNQIPYKIRAEFSMITMGISVPFIENDLGERKRRTLNKLIDIMAEDLRDLLIGYYHKNNSLFYPKIRQVLEGCKCQYKKERKCACKIPYLDLLDEC